MGVTKIKNHGYFYEELVHSVVYLPSVCFPRGKYFSIWSVSLVLLYHGQDFSDSFLLALILYAFVIVSCMLHFIFGWIKDFNQWSEHCHLKQPVPVESVDKGNSGTTHPLHCCSQHVLPLSSVGDTFIHLYSDTDSTLQG